MTLTETLRLKKKYLTFEDMKALDFCEKRDREGSHSQTNSC